MSTTSISGALPKVLIIEEGRTANSLLSHCVRQAECTPIGPTALPDEALTLFRLTTPQAILLDVSQQEQALAVAHRIREQDATVPLFLVGEEENSQVFAQAKLLRAVGYFVLPPDMQALQRSIALCIQREADAVPLAQPLTSKSKIDANGVFVREGNRLVRISPDEITCVQTEEKYCVIITSSGRRHSVRAPLRMLLQNLQPSELVRVHRSWLVNLKHVDHINFY